jgi:hypothetical protein
MNAFLVLLFVLAAVLPIVGFGRLLLLAQRGLVAAQKKVDERGSPLMTYGDFDESTVNDIRKPFQDEQRDLVWDIGLVGLGLIAGSTASIIALPWA